MQFSKLRKAFEKHSQDMSKALTNLEAIVSIVTSFMFHEVWSSAETLSTDTTLKRLNAAVCDDM